MKSQSVLAASLVVLFSSLALAAEESNPIKDAMVFAHKAPKGEKKLNEKILEGTAKQADVERALELYKAMLDSKPPKGDPAEFKAKVAKLITATEEVIAKKPDGLAHYKDAVNCKECHTAHKKSAPPAAPAAS